MIGTPLLVKIGAGVMLGLGASAALGAGVAQAGPPTLPYHCSTGYLDASSGYGACDGGSGSFRGVVYCVRVDGTTYESYGRWMAPVGVPTRSSASCDTGDVATAVSFETSTNPVIEHPDI
jgi:hypothetical protein